jgi:hypothetical protein
MVKKEVDEGVAAAPPEAKAGQARRPILLIIAGRQSRGKSVLASVVWELAQRRYPLKLIEASTNNHRLAERLGDAVLVPEGSSDDRRLWIEDAIAACAAAADTPEQHDLLIDMHGGDDLLYRWGTETGAVQLMERQGLDLVLIHMVGPDPADVDYIADLEAGGVFAPAKTAVIMNGGLVTGNRRPEAAFAPVARRLMEVIKRKILILTMQPLPCMDGILEQNIPFREAGHATDKLTFFDTGRAASWVNHALPKLFAGKPGDPASLNRWLDIEVHP